MSESILGERDRIAGAKIKIWNRCTADEGIDQIISGDSGFKKCLTFTLYRPRDLMSLLNSSFYYATQDNRKTIVMRDIERSAKDISVNRLRDLKKEYEMTTPCLPYAIASFENEEPEMSYSKYIELIRRTPDTIQSANRKDKDREVIATQDFSILLEQGVAQVLFNVGFAGIKSPVDSSFSFCFDAGPGASREREIFPNDTLKIHPCYWRGLNIQKNSLTQDEAESINDEYEQVNKPNPTIRSKKIGELLARIGQIPIGRDDSDAFEVWCFDALSIAFAGRLEIFERHPNQQSTNRRDIVATNSCNAGAWGRIASDYKTRQVIFEVKNLKNINQDEYRQMLSYLSGYYGNVGFIITRDDREEVGGTELEIARGFLHSHQKTIIRLTESFISRILKKMRSSAKDPAEEILSKKLDQFERVISGTPSGRNRK